MSRRRTTIHDATALRLHPNGVRVKDIVPLLSNAPVTTKTPVRRVRTSKGNWIATDAGGNGRVTKRRKRKIQDAIEECFVAEGQGEGDTAETPGQDEIPTRIYKDARANRRMAFENDFSFLAAPTSVLEENLHLSSDFLKCIHHFSSQHYDARGQLFDSALQYRKAKKENRRRRATVESGSQHSNMSQGEGSRKEEEDQSGSDSFPEGQSRPKAKRRPKGKERTKSGTFREPQRDMYKAFDGSALLCIGMLLQSYITSSLVNNVTNTLEDDRSNDSHEDTDMESVKMQSDTAEAGRRRQESIYTEGDGGSQ